MNKGDFLKLEYTGYDDKGNVFDSTSGEIAKKLHNKEGTLLIVFGYDKLVVGLEEVLQREPEFMETIIDCPAQLREEWLLRSW